MKLDIPKYFNRKHFRVGGIYFLLKKGNIVYIGITGDLLNRMMGWKSYCITYDVIRLIQCEPHLRDKYERRWIKLFKPRHNRMWK